MATVYRGFDERLEVERAIKVLAPALAARADIRKRFETEARTMAKLQHANIVSVQDVGTDGDRVYMVMELVETGSLIDHLDRHGAMPPHAACDAIIAILQGLNAAHSRGIVHRDIKPHNVLVTPDGQFKVADFGIAHVSGPERSATRTGMAMGTLSYMAPEQRTNAKQVDGRADLYAVAATFFALLTNNEPFELHAVDHQEEIFAGIPGPLVAVMKRASKFRAEDRYPDAVAMMTAVREARAMIGPDGAVLDGQMPAPNPTLSAITGQGTAPVPPTLTPPTPVPGAPARPMLRTASVPGGDTFQADEFEDVEPPAAAARPAAGPGTWIPDSPPTPSASGRPMESPVSAGSQGAVASAVLAPVAPPVAPARPEPRTATAGDGSTLSPSAGTRRDDPSMIEEPRASRVSPVVIGVGVAGLVGVIAVVGIALWGGSGGATPSAVEPVATAPAATDGSVVASPEPPAAPVAAPVSSAPPAAAPVAPAPVAPPPAAAKPASTATTTASKWPKAEVEKIPVVALPVAAQPVAAPSAPVASQLLTVNVIPYATVSVDGKAQPPGAWTGTVTVGPHHVVMTTADGQTKALDVTVNAMAPKHFCWEFSKESECSH